MASFSKRPYSIIIRICFVLLCVNGTWFLFGTITLYIQINFCFVGHPSRSAVAFTAVTAAQTVSSKSPTTPKKRTMSTIKAITAKLDKDDGDMKAKLSSFVFQFAQLLKTEVKNSDQVYPLDIFLYKVSNENTRLWNLFKAYNRDTLTTSMMSLWFLNC